MAWYFTVRKNIQIHYTVIRGKRERRKHMGCFGPSGACTCTTGLRKHIAASGHPAHAPAPMACPRSLTFSSPVMYAAPPFLAHTLTIFSSLS